MSYYKHLAARLLAAILVVLTSFLFFAAVLFGIGTATTFGLPAMFFAAAVLTLAFGLVEYVSRPFLTFFNTVAYYAYGESYEMTQPMWRKQSIPPQA